MKWLALLALLTLLAPAATFAAETVDISSVLTGPAEGQSIVNVAGGRRLLVTARATANPMPATGTAFIAGKTLTDSLGATFTIISDTPAKKKRGT